MSTTNIQSSRSISLRSSVLGLLCVTGVSLGAPACSSPSIEEAKASSSAASACWSGEPDQGRSKHFPETGKSVQGIFLDYLEQTGGVPAVGLPLTGVFDSRGIDGKTYKTQCFERRVLEYHPEAPCDWKVMGRQLGRERYNRLYGKSAPGQRRHADHDSVGMKGDDDHEFRVSYRLFQHWNDTGGERENGKPMSEELTEDGYTVQYFERAVFQMHPENSFPYDVLGMHLGRMDPECGGDGGAPTNVYKTPDLKSILYIAPFNVASTCADLLRYGINCLEPENAALFSGLWASRNEEPPQTLDDSNWPAFKDSKEYRGFIHLEPMTLTCQGGKVTQYGQFNEERSNGYTKENFGVTIKYSDGEGYTGSERVPGVSAELLDRGDCVQINATIAARVNRAGRILQYAGLGYDAPFIWETIDEKICCDGSVNVSVEHSHFPTSRLYVSGQTVDIHEQRDLGKFIVSGGRILHPDGEGNLAGPQAGPMTWSGTALKLQ